MSRRIFVGCQRARRAVCAADQVTVIDLATCPDETLWRALADFASQAPGEGSVTDT